MIRFCLILLALLCVAKRGSRGYADFVGIMWVRPKIAITYLHVPIYALD